MIDHAAIHGLGPAVGRRPLTGDVPAALTAIGGIPLLGHALDRLAAQGVRRAVLCAHHHRAALAAYLAGRATGPDADILAEAEPLGSAAALAAAAARLGDAPFYAVAADQVWFDGFRPALARLAAKWDEGRMDALILVHPVARAIGYDGRGDIFLDPTGRLASAYPRGLPIGVVSEARQSDANTYKSVLVVPWVDLGSFANVVILTGGGTS